MSGELTEKDGITSSDVGEDQDKPTGKVGRRALMLGAAAGVGAAAAVVAGASPAEAGTGDGGNVQLGQANTGADRDNLHHHKQRVRPLRDIRSREAAFPDTAGVVGDSDSNDGVTGLSSYNNGVSGFIATGGNNGVYGADNTPGGAHGVHGFPNAGTGVYGQNGVSSSGQSAVYGDDHSTSGGYGVQGFSNAATGVYGVSVGSSGLSIGAGVVGDSNTNDGVVGSSSAGNGISGTTSAGAASGVYGQDASGGTDSSGVYGFSDSGTGVYGNAYGSQPAVQGVSGDSGPGVSGSDTPSLGLKKATGTGPGVVGVTYNLNNPEPGSTGTIWWHHGRGGAQPRLQSPPRPLSSRHRAAPTRGPGHWHSRSGWRCGRRRRERSGSFAVQGVATFTRSGVVSLTTAGTSVVVTVPGGLKTTSHVLATLQTDTGAATLGDTRRGPEHLDRQDHPLLHRECSCKHEGRLVRIRLIEPRRSLRARRARSLGLSRVLRVTLVQLSTRPHVLLHGCRYFVGMAVITIGHHPAFRDRQGLKVSRAPG